MGTKPGGIEPGGPKLGGGAPIPGARPSPGVGPISPGAGAPRPMGLLTPGPAVRAATPAPAPVPRRVEGSEGGGPSTVVEIMLEPRRMMRPSRRFSSFSMSGAGGAPGAVGRLLRDLTRRNSSQSAMTRFMCWTERSVWFRKTGREMSHAIEGQHLTR